MLIKLWFHKNGGNDINSAVVQDAHEFIVCNDNE